MTNTTEDACNKSYIFKGQNNIYQLPHLYNCSWNGSKCHTEIEPCKLQNCSGTRVLQNNCKSKKNQSDCINSFVYSDSTSTKSPCKWDGSSCTDPEGLIGTLYMFMCNLND